jgi:hypothetical protein
MINCHVATLLISLAKRFQRNPVLVTVFDEENLLFKKHKKLSSKDGLKIIFGQYCRIVRLVVLCADVY